MCFSLLQVIPIFTEFKTLQLKKNLWLNSFGKKVCMYVKQKRKTKNKKRKTKNEKQKRKWKVGKKQFQLFLKKPAKE